MKNPISLPLALFIMVSCGQKTMVSIKPEGLKQENKITIENENLKVVFVDNEASGPVHKAGYNGISELYHRYEDSSIFVPDYAGFNLEHIFGGDSLSQLFEPRRHPMKLYRKSDNTVILYQEATPNSGVESLTEFKVIAPDYIDIGFQCIFHNQQFFQHGYGGLFWASYIHKPEDKKIYFLGTAEERPDTSWIEAYSTTHGLNSTHRAVGDVNNFFFAENFNASLANHYSEYRYSSPYYFGRFRNMVLAFLFESKDIIRFSQSPTGGGQENPAWDFQFIIPTPETGKIYSFKARIIYKPFVNANDISDEYERWNVDLQR